MNIEIDVHGCTLDEVIHKLQRLIVSNPKCRMIEVIHGFNNGCVIKNALKNKNNIHSKRVSSTCAKPFNEGRTLIYLK